MKKAHLNSTVPGHQTWLVMDGMLWTGHCECGHTLDAPASLPKTLEHLDAHRATVAEDPSKPYLTIANVAAELQMWPKSLRDYEEAGLVIPYRNAGGWRVYSREDVEKIRAVKGLTSGRVSLEFLSDVVRLCLWAVDANRYLWHGASASERIQAPPPIPAALLGYCGDVE